MTVCQKNFFRHRFKIYNLKMTFDISQLRNNKKGFRNNMIFFLINSHNTLNSVLDEQTKFLNQRKKFRENHFHFDFIIYIWS